MERQRAGGRLSVWKEGAGGTDPAFDVRKKRAPLFEAAIWAVRSCKKNVSCSEAQPYSKLQARPRQMHEDVARSLPGGTVFGFSRMFLIIR